MMNIQLPDIPAPVAALLARAEADCRPAFARVEALNSTGRVTSWNTVDSAKQAMPA